MSDTEMLEQLVSAELDKLQSSVGQQTRIAYRTFQRCLQKEIASSGIQNAHWSFLRTLFIEEGLTQRELARRARMLEPATASILKRMEADGLIKRERARSDRRRSHIYLTKRGRTICKELLPRTGRVNDLASKGIPEQDLAQMRKTLSQMIENLETAYDLIGDTPAKET